MAIQVCGKQSKTPYYIEAIKTNVYSLEEINYFVFNHINLVYRDFFCEELFDYIEKELGREDMAQDLRELAQEDADLKDFIRYLLSESYYYSGGELSVVSAYVMNIDSMSESERLKIEADGYFKIGKLESALRVYFDILGRMETEDLSEAFYARVAYSIGVIYARLFMVRNANSFFGYAYELYPEPVYARACVYMALINHDEEELLNTIIKYNISDDTLETVRARVGALRREIETSEDTVNFIYDFENGINSQTIIDNWKEEYYERTS
ncbi:MAG: hypothetical protein IKE48_05345 [Parasporobacterium sp.]|nr:hypothetical protein [Parasporobacterium sp.]